MFRYSTIIILTVLAFFYSTVSAWETDPALNNPVVEQALTQQYIYSVPDGKGGFFVVWMDGRNSGSDIYAQHYDKDGNTLWTDTGAAVSINSSTENTPRAVPADDGGLWVCWADGRYADPDILFNKLNSGGGIVWGTDKDLIINSGTSDKPRSMISDNAGGFIIITDSGRMNRVSSDGSLLWSASTAAPEYIITASAGDGIGACDGSGGVTICWYDNSILLLQQFDADGNGLWSGGTPLTLSITGNVWNYWLQKEGTDYYIMWVENVGGTQPHIFVQKVNSAGSIKWTAGGLQVTASVIATNFLDGLQPDGSGGMYVIWTDNSDSDRYCQHISSAGSTTFPAPVRITTTGTAGWTTTSFLNPLMMSDGAGGFITIWIEASTDTMHMQRYDSSGSNIWSAPVTLSSTSADKLSEPRIINNGQNGGLVTWYDNRNTGTTGYDVYCMAVNADGIASALTFSTGGKGGSGGGCAFSKNAGIGSVLIFCSFLGFGLFLLRSFRKEE